MSINDREVCKIEDTSAAKGMWDAELPNLRLLHECGFTHGHPAPHGENTHANTTHGEATAKGESNSAKGDTSSSKGESNSAKGDTSSSKGESNSHGSVGDGPHGQATGHASGHGGGC